MAISLKELSERIGSGLSVSEYNSISDSQGNKYFVRFKTTNNFSIAINMGYVLEPKNLQEITFVTPFGSNELVTYIGVQIYYNDRLLDNGTWVRYTNQKGFTFGIANDLDTIEDHCYFIAIGLTIYYIVRYNIYKLVQFLSHLNSKFGGEGR